MNITEKRTAAILLFYILRPETRHTATPKSLLFHINETSHPSRDPYLTVFTTRHFWELFLFWYHSALWSYAAEVVPWNNGLITCFVTDLTALCDNGTEVSDVKWTRKNTKCQCTLKTNEHTTTFFFCECPTHTHTHSFPVTASFFHIRQHSNRAGFPQLPSWDRWEIFSGFINV